MIKINYLLNKESIFIDNYYVSNYFKVICINIYNFIFNFNFIDLVSLNID